MLKALLTLISQMFSKKATNQFPSKRQPKSITEVLSKGDIKPPIVVPERFRGKITYNYEKCIGCAMCAKVCPAQAIETYKVNINGKTKKKIVLYMYKCTFCEECVNICPTKPKSLKMEQTFLMANANKLDDDIVIGNKERKENEIKE